MSKTRNIFIRPSTFQTTSILQTLALTAHFAKLAAAADAKAALKDGTDAVVTDTKDTDDGAVTASADTEMNSIGESRKEEVRRDGLRGMMFPREDSQRRLHRWAQLSMSPQAAASLLNSSSAGPSRMAHYTVPLPRLEPDVRAHIGLRDVAQYVGLDISDVSFAGDDADSAVPEKRKLVDVEVKVERTEKNTIGDRVSAPPPIEFTGDRHQEGQTLGNVRRILKTFDGFAGQIKLPDEVFTGREHVSVEWRRSKKPGNASYGWGGEGTTRPRNGSDNSRTKS